MTTVTADEVLDFWFRESDASQWFQGSVEFDALIAARFGELLKRASACELQDWRASFDGRLAEIIVLDQFSRNVYRDSAQAFAQDPLALALSQEAIRAGALEAMPDAVQRAFLLMPWMHSESAVIHAQAERLFREWTPENNHVFELKHKAIIDRFGRYPHRNAVLGRASSAEEIEFLKSPGSSF